MASTPNQCDRLKVPMTVAPQTHARVLSPCRAFRRAHGQRRFSGWISGRWAGRCACGANGAALEHPSRFAEQRCGTSCQHRLIDDWPKQRRFDGGQPESGVQQRQARQYARRGWLGWQHPRHRLFALGVVLRDERFWGSGRKRRQLDGHAGAGERNDRQEGSKPCRKAALQHPASMRPPTGTSVVSHARQMPPDRGASRQQQRMVPASEEVKSPQHDGRMPPGSGDALPDGAAI